MRRRRPHHGGLICDHLATVSADPHLRDLLDKQAIHELLLRYCRGLDRCDEALLASAFHPDAVVEHTGQTLTGARIAGFLVSRSLQAGSRHAHYLANHLVGVRGDDADSECYFFSYRIGLGQAEIQTFKGRYLDRFERRSGEWRIARRTVVIDWSTREPFSHADLFPGAPRGARSHDDPSYSLSLLDPD
jgi:SnoaL-like protein